MTKNINRRDLNKSAGSPFSLLKRQLHISAGKIGSHLNPAPCWTLAACNTLKNKPKKKIKDGNVKKEQKERTNI
jgi:hypothetical protein